MDPFTDKLEIFDDRDNGESHVIVQDMPGEGGTGILTINVIGDEEHDASVRATVEQMVDLWNRKNADARLAEQFIADRSIPHKPIDLHYFRRLSGPEGALKFIRFGFAYTQPTTAMTTRYVSGVTRMVTWTGGDIEWVTEIFCDTTI